MGTARGDQTIPPPRDVKVLKKRDKYRALLAEIDDDDAEESSGPASGKTGRVAIPSKPTKASKHPAASTKLLDLASNK